MISNEPSQIIELLYQKLKRLERKLELSYSTTKNNQQKTLQLGKDLLDLRAVLTKLDQKTLSWNDLIPFGISKNKIYQEATAQKEIAKKELSDFGLLSSIPKIKLIESSGYDFINELYSIMNYLNDNYQTIFTQKVLLTSSKTNTVREKFYILFQEILRLFRNYQQLIAINHSQRSNDMVIQKEYKLLLNKILSLLELMKQYFKLIQEDPTFSQEDFLHLVVSTNNHSSISNLTLQTAFEECKHYIDETIEYINIQSTFDNI
ncbi:MAG: hypothetical protein ACRCVW_03005 [Brevinema sp.]